MCRGGKAVIAIGDSTLPMTGVGECFLHSSWISSGASKLSSDCATVRHSHDIFSFLYAVDLLSIPQCSS